MDIRSSPARSIRLIPLAHALGDLHRQWYGDPVATAGTVCRRAELVSAIDTWVITRVPRRRSTTHIRTESLGAT
ncbi:hypothetical protein AB0L63_01930 [Nocardia sp. NPDC051990]|uniref:hypothetical protein n=1 Tax=Nocardia sp. NPDC051990 TaxID=3155285 RepID=UPI00341EBBCE